MRAKTPINADQHWSHSACKTAVRPTAATAEKPGECSRFDISTHRRQYPTRAVPKPSQVNGYLCLQGYAGGRQRVRTFNPPLRRERVALAAGKHRTQHSRGTTPDTAAYSCDTHRRYAVLMGSRTIAVPMSCSRITRPTRGGCHNCTFGSHESSASGKLITGRNATTEAKQRRNVLIMARQQAWLARAAAHTAIHNQKVRLSTALTTTT